MALVTDVRMLLTTILVLSIIYSNNADENLSVAYLVQSGSPIEKLHSTYPIQQSPVTFLVNYTDPNYLRLISNISEKHIPVVVGANVSAIPYDLTSYFSKLNTTNFGRNLIFAENIPSTMDIGRDFGNVNGLVVIAKQQTKGRGSNDTTWNSPPGDVYMNINLNLTNNTQVGLLPIHCALSLIRAVETTSSSGKYSKLPIKFSWPISISWMPWNKKIGGVLVEAIQTNEFNNNSWYTSSCGLRVNSELEYSVSKMINEYNGNNRNSPIEQLELPSLIARTVNYLEEYYKLLERDPNAFIKEVMRYWVNDNRKFVLNLSSKIVDLKGDGSIVLNDDNGSTIYLQPKPGRFGSFGFDQVNFVN